MYKAQGISYYDRYVTALKLLFTSRTVHLKLTTAVVRVAFGGSQGSGTYPLSRSNCSGRNWGCGMAAHGAHSQPSHLSGSKFSGSAPCSAPAGHGCVEVHLLCTGQLLTE